MLGTEAIRYKHMNTDKRNILVVEDESDIRNLISTQLQRAGYNVEAVADGETALSKLGENNYEVLVLDWMLPSVSGVEISQKVRSGFLKISKTVPILMVTAKTEVNDIVHGLEMGADDYITKPFESAVLLARVSSLLRRSGFKQDSEKTKEELAICNISIRTEFHEVLCEGEKLSLTLSEYKLLVALVSHRGRVL